VEWGIIMATGRVSAGGEEPFPQGFEGYGFTVDTLCVVVVPRDYFEFAAP